MKTPGTKTKAWSSQDKYKNILKKQKYIHLKWEFLGTTLSAHQNLGDPPLRTATCSPQWPLRPPKSQRSFLGCVHVCVCVCVCVCVLLLLFNPCQSIIYYLNELVKDFIKPSAHLSGRGFSFSGPRNLRVNSFHGAVFSVCPETSAPRPAQPLEDGHC